MVTLQDISFSYLDVDTKNGGLDFSATINFKDERVGYAELRSEGSTDINYTIKDEFREDFTLAVKTFIEHLRNHKDNTLMAVLIDKYVNYEQAFLRYLLTMSLSEKPVGELLEQGAKRVAVFGAFLTDSEMSELESNVRLNVPMVQIVPNDKYRRPDEILDLFKNNYNNEHLNFIRVVSTTNSLSVSF